jgi:hypothetical protein
MTSKVKRTEATKLTKKENIIIDQYKIPERGISRSATRTAFLPAR